MFVPIPIFMSAGGGSGKPPTFKEVALLILFSIFLVAVVFCGVTIFTYEPASANIWTKSMPEYELPDDYRIVKDSKYFYVQKKTRNATKYLDEKWEFIGATYGKWDNAGYKEFAIPFISEKKAKGFTYRYINKQKQKNIDNQYVIVN